MGGPGSGRRADPGRRRRAAELRARGLSLEQVGRELGVSKQAVAKLLGRTGVPDPGHIRCAACGAAVARPTLWTPRARPSSAWPALRHAPTCPSTNG